MGLKYVFPAAYLATLGVVPTGFSWLAEPPTDDAGLIFSRCDLFSRYSELEKALFSVSLRRTETSEAGPNPTTYCGDVSRASRCLPHKSTACLHLGIKSKLVPGILGSCEQQTY